MMSFNVGDSALLIIKFFLLPPPTHLMKHLKNACLASSEVSSVILTQGTPL